MIAASIIAVIAEALVGVWMDGDITANGQVVAKFDDDTHLGELLADLGVAQWPFFSGEEVEVEGDYKAMLDAGRKIVWLDGKLWERVT